MNEQQWQLVFKLIKNKKQQRVKTKIMMENKQYQQYKIDKVIDDINDLYLLNKSLLKIKNVK